MKLNHIYLGDCLTGLAILADNSVDCCVTSPPYFGLRDYGVEGQIGLEETPEAYIQRLVGVFGEVRRVLKPNGTLWVNIGDSYATAAKQRNEEQACRKSGLAGGKAGQIACKNQINKITGDLKPKDLIGIPWMLAFALRADGWYLRQDIIWSKPNPMPESVQDRCTKAHEYIFMLSKSARYYYDADAIRTPAAESSIARWNQDIESQNGSGRVPGKTNGTMKAVGGPRLDKQRGHSRRHAGFNERWDSMSGEEQRQNGANKRSVWNVATKPFTDSVESYHWQRVPLDAVSGGMKRITSLDCPVHGLLGRSGSSLFCGAHEADALIHKSYIDDCLALVRPYDSSSIAQKYASDFGLHNWDSDRQSYVLSAIRHSIESHKTDHDLLTNPACTSYAQTRARIERILEIRETFGSAGRMLLSNTLPDEMDDLLWGQIHSHSANSSSLSNGCSCAIYKKITKKTDHFATFPEDLIIPCIKAGCPPNGLVLDPFMGAGTTAVVARKQGRNYVGFELNPEYIAIAKKRLQKQLGPLDVYFQITRSDP